MQELHEYIRSVNTTAERIDPKLASLFRLALERVTQRFGTVYTAGNGGSATVADHFALGMSLNVMREAGKGHRAVSLTANTALLTAAANDFGHANALGAILRSYNPSTTRDVLLVVSGSGRSENILSLVEEANRLQLLTMAIVGHEGTISRAANLRIVLGAPSSAVAEDAAIMLLHWLYCSFMTKDAA